MTSKKVIEVSFKDILMIGFIVECLNQGIEFWIDGESIYPASAVYKSLISGKKIDIIFPNKNGNKST